MHYFVQKLRKPAIIALAGLTLTVCGGKDSGSPSQPSVPVAFPTATPIAAPTPQPPVSASCAKLPPAAVDYTCRTEHASFKNELDQAIDTVKSEHPEAFDGEYVKNVGLYIVEVIKAFDKMGICADYDGEELGVATRHNFNDQYDILTARSEVRRYFVGSCYPSVVPVSRKLGGIPGGCNLPPSREVSCGDPAPLYEGAVAGAIDQLLKTKPELFDFNDVAKGTEWPRVKDTAAYYQAIIDILVAKGYCGLFDGEEIEVKRTNEFSEHYDVNYADKYIRTGPGIFRGSCYPAAF